MTICFLYMFVDCEEYKEDSGNGEFWGSEREEKRRDTHLTRQACELYMHRATGRLRGAVNTASSLDQGSDPQCEKLRKWAGMPITSREAEPIFMSPDLARVDTVPHHDRKPWHVTVNI